jgi:hypothetical protein
VKPWNLQNASASPERKIYFAEKWPEDCSCGSLKVVKFTYNRQNRGFDPMKTANQKICRWLNRMLLAAAFASLAPTALAQNLFEADLGSGNINQFSLVPSQVVVQTSLASRLSLPRAIAINSANVLFVSQGSNVLEITQSGTTNVFISSLPDPAGLAFDNAGNLFVSDLTSNTIYKFTSNGTQSTFATGLSTPISLAFDSSDDLFEADFGSGRIFEFTAQGTTNVFASGALAPKAPSLPDCSFPPAWLSITRASCLKQIPPATTFLNTLPTERKAPSPPDCPSRTPWLLTVQTSFLKRTL